MSVHLDMGRPLLEQKVDWLKIVINEDYQDISFDGEKTKAGKQVKIVQNCLSETTLDSIFGLSETFQTSKVL